MVGYVKFCTCVLPYIIAFFSVILYFLHLCLQISESQCFTRNCCMVTMLPSLIRAQMKRSLTNETQPTLVNTLIHSMWSGTRRPVKSNGVVERWALAVQPSRYLCEAGPSSATSGQLVTHYMPGNILLSSGQGIRPFSSPLCMPEMVALNWLPSLMLLEATLTMSHLSTWPGMSPLERMALRGWE